MSTPHRFVAMTYNVWESARWPERADALRAVLELTGPDVLCIQELRPASREVIDAALPTHDRVEDELPGWACEGTIYWRRALFDLVEHGAGASGAAQPGTAPVLGAAETSADGIDGAGVDRALHLAGESA